MSDTPKTVAVLGKRGEARVLHGHPWIFRSDVQRLEGALPGAVVRLEGPFGRPLGFGQYSSASEIRLRVVERGERLSPDWMRERLQRAIAWREQVAPGAEACRLVHGEGDGLPALVVDRYRDVLVVQTLSQGMDAARPELVRHLKDLLAPRGILARNDPRVRTLEGLPQEVALLDGVVPETLEVREGGVTYEVDPWKGQKTGLFLDQRENHLQAAAYAKGRVLDGFSYNGGFALQVARQAKEVLAVDVSTEAVQRIQRNAERNGIANVTVKDANVFDLLRALDDAGERFDTVILDPPAFAKSRDAAAKAKRGYKEINLRALKILSPGGTLITCSCSYHVHEPEFEQVIEHAAYDAGVTVTLVEKRRQARDHPILLAVPETYYLKCFVLRRLA